MVHCLGLDGVATFYGVLVGTSRLCQHRRKLVLIVGLLVCAFDLIGRSILAFYGDLSLSGWPDDAWYSLAWCAGAVGAMAVRLRQAPLVVEWVRPPGDMVDPE